MLVNALSPPPNPPPPKRPPVAGLLTPAGGAPAGVVDPPNESAGFAGVAVVAEAVDVLAAGLFMLPNSPPAPAEGAGADEGVEEAFDIVAEINEK